MPMTNFRSGEFRQLPASAHTKLALLLAAIAGCVTAVDAIWSYAGGFRVDVRSYVVILLLLAPLIFGAFVYNRLRPDPLISATCTAAAFLLAFSASCAMLSYLLSTIAGTRIDAQLAQIDHAMGFNWIAVMTFAAKHRLLTEVLGIAYLSALPQIMLLVMILGWSGRAHDLYGLCLAIAVGALLCVLVWTVHPSFGAFSVFDLPRPVAARLGLALNGSYGQDLVGLLKNGPGLISPRELRGIVGFPSFHTVQALVLIWYIRRLAIIRWVGVPLNILVIFATPIHGGHHLVDVFGGVGITVAAVFIADWLVHVTSESSSRNKRLYDRLEPGGLDTAATY